MICQCPCGCHNTILKDIDEPYGRTICWDCQDNCEQEEDDFIYIPEEEMI